MDDSAFEIDISNRQSVLTFDEASLRHAIERTLVIEQVASAVLSISVVDNPTIHVINRDHLQHDYPTDVISFQLDFIAADDLQCDDEDEFESDEEECELEPEDDEEFDDEEFDEGDSDLDDADSRELKTEGRAAGSAIEGEIIASAEMAVSMAAEGRWSSESELTLYVVHGLLHICGYDDLTPEEKVVMRARERFIMNDLGLTAVYAEDAEEERH